MGDSTLPPTAATALSSSQSSPPPLPQSSSSSKKTTTKIPNRRVVNKVGLKKGFGLHDWARLLKVAKDPSQRNGVPLRNITAEEIKKHCDEYDGWCSLRGKVYNLTPYLYYHPGGIDILKPCLGKDATVLFEKYHRWVNIESLIGPLLLGYLVVPSKDDDDDNDGSSNKTSKRLIPSSITQPNNGKDDSNFTVPAPRPPRNVPSMLPPQKHSSSEMDVDVDPWETKP